MAVRHPQSNHRHTRRRRCLATFTAASASGGANNSTGGRNADTNAKATHGKAKMTDPMLGITPRCFICQALDNLTLIEPPTWACHDHLDGEGQPYLENGGQID